MLNAGYCAIIYEAFRAQGFDRTHGLGVEAAIVVMAISSIGFVIPVSAGMGTYHYLFGGPLRLLYAVPQAPAMACATVVHALAHITYGALGGPGLLIQWMRARKRDQSTQTTSMDPPT